MTILFLKTGTTTAASTDDDWADFQGGADTSQNVPAPDTSTPDLSSSSSLVNVKKESLNSSEILGLFKVRSEPVTSVKSKDDDIRMSSVPDLSVSDSMNKIHGIRASSNSPDSFNLKVHSSRSNRADDDDDNLFAPPPMDDFAEDEQDDYHRGYDFDDVMKPNSNRPKKMYGGIYGANENFVLEGGKKKPDQLKSKLSDPQFHIESDNDSDSMKDYDVFKRKLSLGKPVEDSQSIASLEFVMNKNLQVAKDDGDAQSQSSTEFGNFELGPPKETLPESKSLDSLDLRQDDVSESVDNGSTITDKPSTTVESETGVTGMLPVLGDRYSAILAPEPTVSYKSSVLQQN